VTPNLYSFNPIPPEFTSLLTPTSWLNGSVVAAGATTPLTPPQLIMAHQNVAVPYVKSRGDLIYLDGEVIGSDPALTAEIIQIFAAKMPAIRRGYFGPSEVHTRETIIAAAANPTQRGPVQQWFVSWQGVFRLLDYIDCPAYLLGPGVYVDRDLAFIEAFHTLARIYAPGCKPIFSVWGNFHTNWNPDNVPLPDDVLTKYVGVLRRLGTDFIVFDPKPSRDVKFLQMLSGAQPTIRAEPTP
jgi:hypothetical protein